MDLDAYRDIAPYRGQDFLEAIQRVKSNPEGITSFLRSVVSVDTEEQRQNLKRKIAQILSLLDEVTDYDQFQRRITAGLFLQMIVENSISGFSYSGIENLDSSTAYLYMSNHRDIVLDCALIDLALDGGGQMLCEMAIGDNLLKTEFATDLFKLNGGVTVKRSLPMREKYLESLRLSSYLFELISEHNKSVWIAQKSGRSKDGLDITNPAIIKMLYLSQRKKGVDFNEVVNRGRIVPVAVSYEYDPVDVLKSKEEVLASSLGRKEKRQYEDLISISRGLKGYKGRVHIAFGTPIHGSFSSSEEVAYEIDHQIHTLYKLWPTNYFAYDHLNGSDAYAALYADFDGEAFLKRFKGLKKEVRTFALNAYANPVRSFLATQA
ncbi:MAG TPA: 1-acyl-sn-glycerol-3-phosphate acyltransferase [Sphaerochaeta sp.]|jgi:hypothetical protein|nr:1-acyl-sn-glycerol-3-phosphate acyltransferase [Sphaerochaeta sp.]